MKELLKEYARVILVRIFFIFISITGPMCINTYGDSLKYLLIMLALTSGCVIWVELEMGLFYYIPRAEWRKRKEKKNDQERH